MDEVRQTIDAATAEELGRICVPPDSPGHPTDERTVPACLHVILNEEWEHNRYTRRDLDVLEPNEPVPGGAEDQRCSQGLARLPEEIPGPSDGRGALEPMEGHPGRTAGKTVAFVIPLAPEASDRHRSPEMTASPPRG